MFKKFFMRNKKNHTRNIHKKSKTKGQLYDAIENVYNTLRVDLLPYGGVFDFMQTKLSIWDM